MSKPQTFNEAFGNLQCAMEGLWAVMQTVNLGNGVIYLSPKCPECKQKKPNEIQDGGKRPLYQCAACGHLWERIEIPVSDVRITYQTVVTSSRD